ncbi:hypothetical protein [Micromonospora sp. WMMD714]|nr:hypothetical protein [Micromonospora sp. WMMD714]WFE63732.1 hypothetical protein O7625_10735 [Micromonospora sp. WMMD714]
MRDHQPNVEILSEQVLRTTPREEHVLVILKDAKTRTDLRWLHRKRSRS